MLRIPRRGTIAAVARAVNAHATSLVGADASRSRSTTSTANRRAFAMASSRLETPCAARPPSVPPNENSAR